MSRSRSRLFPAVITGVVLIAALALASAFSVLPHFSNPVKEKEVDRTGPAVLQSLADLADYHASTGELSVIVDIEKDVKWVPSFIAGEHITYQAVATVDGVVDLSEITSRAVTVSGTGEKVVTIVVPHAKLSKVTMDLERSKVIGHDRGVANRFADFFKDNPAELQELQKKSVPKLQAAARETRVLELAETNTRKTLTNLAQQAGADRVIVDFENPPTPGGT